MWEWAFGSQGGWNAVQGWNGGGGSFVAEAAAGWRSVAARAAARAQIVLVVIETPLINVRR
ncbi:hypothetical protein ACIBI9_52905 [Nonomuraea sp. NPDC050451]|uniref:hypothetical protein n=1 Tax=Nonomuraea sp. NPDC050451 TaxID=3364364 RepID=UPI0037B2417F